LSNQTKSYRTADNLLLQALIRLGRLCALGGSLLAGLGTIYRVAREVKGTVMKTEIKKLNQQEKEQDFFCIVSDAFRIFARRSSIALGSAWAFAGAMLVILVWVLSGPMFHFSNTWQLVINTGTTIVTFLMVFLIQNTQNRDAKAVHLKLDELIRAIKNARNELVYLEDLSDEELKKLEEQFKSVRKRAENDGSPSRHTEPAELR
jgi:low affinity Fe/Cu permease